MYVFNLGSTSISTIIFPCLGSGDDSIVDELVQGVESGSVPAWRATNMANKLSRKFRKKGSSVQL